MGLPFRCAVGEMRTHELSLVIRLKNPQFTTGGFFYERNVLLVFWKKCASWEETGHWDSVIYIDYLSIKALGFESESRN